MSLTLASALFLLTAVADPQVRADQPAVAAVPVDSTLAAFQGELLDIAFESATAIPLKPHHKDRARAQEAVVTTCLELGQPQRALRCIERIDGWRRGAAYADLAFYCARHGYTAEAQGYLDLAGQVARGVEDWRRDNIRVRIARAHVWLGQERQARELEAGIDPAEAGKVAGARATRSDPESFDRQVTELDGLVASGHFDTLRNALGSYADLYNRIYDDAARRAQVEERIKASWSTLPLFIRIDLLMKLADSAIAHSDQGKAIELVNEAQLLFDGAEWLLERRIPLAGKLAEVRYRAGDTAKAQADAVAALAIFDTDGLQIVDIYRAGALRPLAEAFHSMGDTAAAIAVYTRAVEAGVANPNSRPRAEDLSATCGSMARNGVEPDAELWTRIRRVSAGLGPPW
jgi:hypothetical protein